MATYEASALSKAYEISTTDRVQGNASLCEQCGVRSIGRSTYGVQLRVPPAGLAFLETPFTEKFAFRCRAMTRVYFVELQFPQYKFSISLVALEVDASQRYIP